MPALSAPTLLSVCPEPLLAADLDLRASVVAAARSSEAAGFRGLLLPSEHSLADPWLLAERVAEHTRRLRPVIVVQPADEHPFAIARRIVTFWKLHERPLDLLLTACNRRGDLVGIGDRLKHDARYDRLVELGRLIQLLVSSPTAVTFEGTHYRLYGQQLPPLPAEALPEIYVSGSSPAAANAAARLEATRVLPPRSGTPMRGRLGVRLGVLAREQAEEAWELAHRRFPVDAARRLQHRLEMRWSDSEWHRQLSRLRDDGDSCATRYWLEPFDNGRSPSPYLVGGYRGVARELAQLMRDGVGTFLIDGGTGNEAGHAVRCVRQGWYRAHGELARCG